MQTKIDRFAPALFAATIFLSAALLFSVQPLVARMALPLLGGTPAVWAVSMCVFQGLLLAGYCYAHVLSSRLGLRAGAGVHLAVLVIAAATLPITLRVGAAGPPEAAGTWWLIGVLVASIGLPFFALSANAPLLQSWYARLGTRDAADPYWLYLGSNAGSLIALLAYPVVFEPLLGLAAQRALWAIGFALLIAAIGACAMTLRLAADAPLSAHASSTTEAAHASWRVRVHWIALAFVPSGLLVAFTTFLTTDLASAPLLWVIPLALFLATFLVVFRDPVPVPMQALRILQPVSIVVTLAALEWNAGWSWAVSAVGGLIAFFVTSLVCHRTLYERRPPASGAY